MNLRSFCSRAGLGYQELIVDDSLINKVYEITFSPAARSSTLGIPDGCVDVQFLGSGAQEECFVAGSLLKGHRSDSSCYERCFGIKFMPGPKCCFSKLDAQALFNRRIEASAYVDIDVLRDIDALQFLVSAITVRTIGFRYPVIVDVEGYKSRQREKLESIARSSANRAASQNRSIKLRPMTPYERRIVHICLRDDDRVETASEGEGSARHVVILPR